MKNINKQLVFFILITASINFSCKKFLEIPSPKDAATSVEMFANDATATSAVTGIYSRMAANGAFSGNQNSISVISGLSADELKDYNTSLNAFYKNEIPTTDGIISTSFWREFYTYIYTSNAILDALMSAKGVSESTVKQLQGEAKFIRAFCYFYLVNLFGEVPLNLTTDYRINEIAGKSKKEKIYEQIITDLIDAENLLSNEYVTTERVRPNRWAAKTLLARTYLYNEKWDLAARKATEVIEQKATYELVKDLDQVFLKNSKEAIWQLMPAPGINTKEGTLFILTSTPAYVSLSPDFLPFFMTDDNRKLKWIKTYSNVTGTYNYPYKYKIKTTVNGAINEYSMVIRLAELYLVRAEALAKQGQPELALEDVNLIRERAGIAIRLTGLNASECLTEIENQRRFELFSEWGHRWLDLKRTSRASTVLTPLKGITWQDTDVLYPIPAMEVARNPNVSQNLGY